jgi:hypothetical protein
MDARGRPQRGDAAAPGGGLQQRVQVVCDHKHVALRLQGRQGRGVGSTSDDSARVVRTRGFNAAGGGAIWASVAAREGRGETPSATATASTNWGGGEGIKQMTWEVAERRGGGVKVPRGLTPPPPHSL